MKKERQEVKGEEIEEIKEEGEGAKKKTILAKEVVAKTVHTNGVQWSCEEDGLR